MGRDWRTRARNHFFGLHAIMLERVVVEKSELVRAWIAMFAADTLNFTARAARFLGLDPRT